MMRCELAYRTVSTALFARIAARPWAVFLDSGFPGSSHGRYDILAAEPWLTPRTCGCKTAIRSAEGVRLSPKDPFALLKQTLAPGSASSGDLPFVGGAIGYFGYDLARCIGRLPSLAQDAERIPEMAVGIYDWAVVVDHHARRSWLVAQGRDPRTHAQWAALQALFSNDMAVPEPAPFRVTSRVTSNFDHASYAAAFLRVQSYITEGDCYQVNLAQRFCAAAEGDGWDAYRRLREISPAPFAAYLNTPDAQILSASPERFLSVRCGKVETKPIKGTRPRAADLAQDRANATALLASPKDRAENLMIVDLLRNDISKNCAVGSVRAKQLFQLESFANVHHLVSTVTGRLAQGRDAIDLLRGCFPGGSVTGAPKQRAMEIIEELEPHRRGVYCGAIGYIGFDGNMDTNIAIRTAIYSAGQIRFWAGGGLVADSEMDKEYRETWDKASAMLELMRRCGAHHVGR